MSPQVRAYCTVARQIDHPAINAIIFCLADWPLWTVWHPPADQPWDTYYLCVIEGLITGIDHTNVRGVGLISKGRIAHFRTVLIGGKCQGRAIATGPSF